MAACCSGPSRRLPLVKARTRSSARWVSATTTRPSGASWKPAAGRLGEEALTGMAWQGYYLDTEGNTFGIHQPDPAAA